MSQDEVFQSVMLGFVPLSATDSPSQTVVTRPNSNRDDPMAIFIKENRESNKKINNNLKKSMARSFLSSGTNGANWVSQNLD